MRLWPGLFPRPSWGAYSAPPDTLAGWGRKEEGGREKGTEKGKEKGTKEEEGGGEGYRSVLVLLFRHLERWCETSVYAVK